MPTPRICKNWGKVCETVLTCPYCKAENIGPYCLNKGDIRECSKCGKNFRLGESSSKENNNAQR